MPDWLNSVFQPLLTSNKLAYDNRLS